MNHSIGSRHLLATGLAMLAGFVDATGFLTAQQFFVSFMSGNTTRFAVNLVIDREAATMPALLIGGFLIGVVGGALVADRAGTRSRSVILGICTVLLLCAAVAQTGQNTIGFLTGSVLAMGAINNTFRRNGEVTIGVTYMTGALVRFGQGFAAFLQGKPREGWLLHLALWAGLVCGAVGGAAAYVWSRSLSAWVAVAMAACLTAGALWMEQRRQSVT